MLSPHYVPRIIFLLIVFRSFSFKSALQEKVLIVVVVVHLEGPLAPRALSKDLVEVEGHRVLGDQALDFLLQSSGQDSHQGLGGETILGALFVVTCGEKSTNINVFQKSGIKTMYVL